MNLQVWLMYNIFVAHVSRLFSLNNDCIHIFSKNHPARIGVNKSEALLKVTNGNIEKGDKC